MKLIKDYKEKVYIIRILKIIKGISFLSPDKRGMTHEADKQIGRPV